MKLQFRKHYKLRLVIKHKFLVFPKALENNLKRKDKVKIILFFSRVKQKRKPFAGRQLGL